MMKLTDFYYDLPQELIAQDPLLKRSESRLMVLDRKDNTIEHKHFYDVIDYLNPGDCLVINDTRVLPARLMGVKEDTGASIEVDRKSTRLNSSHNRESRMPSSA